MVGESVIKVYICSLLLQVHVRNRDACFPKVHREASSCEICKDHGAPYSSCYGVFPQCQPMVSVTRWPVTRPHYLVSIFDNLITIVLTNSTIYWTSPNYLKVTYIQMKYFAFNQEVQVEYQSLKPKIYRVLFFIEYNRQRWLLIATCANTT